MIWQSKMLLFQSKFNSADKMIEDAKKLALQITLDVRFSFRVNEGSIALEKVLASINDAGKQGYNITKIENEFDSANSLLTEAKNDYINGNYDGIDSNIDSVLKTSDNISQEIENLKAINHQASENVSTLEPTGLVIKDYSWISYIVGIAIIMVAVFLVFRRKSSKFSYHYKRRLF
jgi:cytolysin (calcineurin-like family phosphatase)